MRQYWPIAILLLLPLAACDRSAPPPAPEPAAQTPTAPTPFPASQPVAADRLPKPKNPARGLMLTNQTPDTCVASKNSTFFHRPECEFAQTISKANLVQYKNREEAIAAGRVACNTCQP